MLHLIFSQTSTPPPSEVVQQAAQVIDAFSNLGPLLAVLFIVALLIALLGGAVFVLVWSNRNSSNISLTTLAQVAADKAKENEALIAREQQYRDQFLATLAVLAGKQADIATGLTASEARMTHQVTTSEATVKARVETVGAANIARLDKIDKALALIQTTVNLFTDPSSEAKYDKALEILTAQLEVIAADIKDIHADVAAGAEVGAANTTAITDAADALAASTPPVPAEVVVADISPQAVASIMDAVTPKGSAEGSTAA